MVKYIFLSIFCTVSAAAETIDYTAQLSGPLTPSVRTCSEYTITRDFYSSGKAASGGVSVNRSFSLSQSGHGTFYSDSACKNSLSTAVILKGNYSVNFYFQDTVAEPVSLSDSPVDLSFWVGSTFPVTVVSQGPTPPPSCPYGTKIADGCTGAPSGTPQLPNLLDIKKVVMLNIIPGSDYKNGTYTWSTSGGGGSGATGTVTVTNGYLGGSTSQGYTISNEGSGYTSRPTIIVSGLTGGSGGSITPSVYQATPHNAATTWNMPGIDYYVGVPSGTILKDPTVAANLPSGAAYASSIVTITGCNVTLNSFDFTLHNTAVVVNISAKNCVTTIENSKFQANATADQTIANLLSLGSGGSFIFQQNTYDGLAPTGGSGSGFAVNDPIQGNGGGSVTLKYNYFHNFDSKIIQMGGTSPAGSLTEKYNLFADYGSCATPPCSHGEGEYTYSIGGTLSFIGEFNTYILHFHTGDADLTAPHAVEADTMNITGTADDHNIVFAPGPQLTCNQYNATAYTGSAAVYDGQQTGGALSNISFSYDYIDNSGTYFPWYHKGGTNVSYTNNVDAGTAGPCNCTTIGAEGTCN